MAEQGVRGAIGPDASSARVAALVSQQWPAMLLLLGALLRIAIYLGNRSLWIDEARVALNILHRGPGALLRPPLDFAQVAPPGFLLLVKTASLAFGNSERALRLVPLLFGLASLPLFLSLARRHLRPGAAIVACALFAVAEPPVYYSTELKQYSGDVFVALILFAAAPTFGRRLVSFGASLVFGLAGAVALALSYTAVFVLPGIALALGIEAWLNRRRKALFGVALSGGLWLVALAGLYVIAWRPSTRNPELVRYFTVSVPGFPPKGVLAAAFWAGGQVFALFEDPGGLARGGISALCAAVGALCVVRRDWRCLVMWTAPGALVLAAALVGVYPFAERLILFLVPSLYLLIAEGFEEIRSRTWDGAPLIASALLTLLLLRPVITSARSLVHPRNPEQLEPVLREVSAARRRGDVVYLYRESQPAARYYLETRDLSLADVGRSELLAPPVPSLPGLGWNQPALLSRPPGFLVGPGSQDWAQERRQLDELAGNARVWFIFSHVMARHGADERALVLLHLDGFGKRLAAFEQPGASAYLYDLRR